MTVRAPAVAGIFYPGRAEDLRRTIDGLIPAGPKERVVALVAPHAGYVYSGRVAGAVYGRVEIPAEVVVLCFNHRGRGSAFALPPQDAWRTPLGDAPVDAALLGRIRSAFPEAEPDAAGHDEEHSGEVQVPFLQRLRPGVRIAPVALSGGLDDAGFERLRRFGRALAEVEGDFLVVASTDLNHYEDQETTLRKDGAAIRAMEALDEEGLRETLTREDVSMCGAAPVVAALAYAKARGARRARTVLHATSGDVTGDYGRVVGYVGMTIPPGNESDQ